MRNTPGFWKDEDGSSAAEFGLVLGVFLALVFGIIGLSLTVWAETTLQYAVQATARCLSVTPSRCTNLQTYAMSQYAGPNISPSFTQAASSCGSGSNAVQASATIPLDAVVVSRQVHLSATACFPKISS
jgi:Flp pilus assembly protein TadG